MSRKKDCQTEVWKHMLVIIHHCFALKPVSLITKHFELPFYPIDFANQWETANCPTIESDFTKYLSPNEANNNIGHKPANISQQTASCLACIIITSMFFVGSRLLQVLRGNASGWIIQIWDLPCVHNKCSLLRLGSFITN